MEKLGEGAYGAVYRAEREIENDKIFCAIKIISLAGDETEASELYRVLGNEESVGAYYQDWIKDFTREIQTMEKLQGITNIVSIQDYEIIKTDKMSWTIYIRMELLQSFTKYLQSHTMDEAEIIRLGEDVCTALEYCEKAKVVHRDIKPDNIFVSEMGNYKLGDFGVAKRMDMTRSRYSSRGTYTYMAPEVYRGERYDQRADIYSLGLVLYRLSNGNREPFLDLNRQMIYYKDREEALRRRMSGEEVPPAAYASEKLAKVIGKATRYKPDERYESASKFRRALMHAAEEQPPVKEEKRKPSSGKRRKVQAATITGVILLAGAGGIVTHSPDKKKAVETEVQSETIAMETISKEIIARETETSQEQQTTEAAGDKVATPLNSVDISGGADFVFEKTETGVKIKRYVFTKKIKEMMESQGIEEGVANKIIEEIDLEDFIVDPQENIQPGMSVTMKYAEKDMIKKQYGISITFSKVVKVYN